MKLSRILATGIALTTIPLYGALPPTENPGDISAPKLQGEVIRGIPYYKELSLWDVNQDFEVDALAFRYGEIYHVLSYAPEFEDEIRDSKILIFDNSHFLLDIYN